MKIAGKTDIGRNRAENQDTFRSGEVPKAGAWGVVCDGMGGGNNGRLAGAVAADCMEEMLYQQLRERPEGLSPRQMLHDSIALANAEVFARAGQDGGMMGTTVVCALMCDGRLHLAHVGDSRAYLYEDGHLRQLTRDHSVVQELVDMGSLSAAQAAHHPEKNVITRALGVEPEVEASYDDIVVAPGAIILLCSDGLSHVVSAEQIDHMLGSIDFYDLPRELVQAALDAGGEDNITVLLMQVEKRDVGA